MVCRDTLRLLRWAWILLLGSPLATGCDPVRDSGGVSVAWKVTLPGRFADASSEPSTDGERVFLIGSGNASEDRTSGVLALALDDGRQLWRTNPFVGTLPSYSTTHGGRVFVGTEVAAALDIETGRELWRMPVPSSLDHAQPGADDGAFYTVSRALSAYAFDAETGTVRWTVDLGPEWWDGIGKGAVSADGVVYVSAERKYPPNGYLSQGVVVALDAVTGRERWRYVNGDGTDSRNVIGAPVAAGDLLLLADLRGSSFLALDRATGRERWRVETTPGFIGPFQPPAVADGVAYATAPDERIYAIDLATGRVLWTAHPPETSGGLYHAVCGSVVLSNHFSVVATERATGRVLTHKAYPQGTATSGFAVAGRRAVFVTDDGAAALDCP